MESSDSPRERERENEKGNGNGNGGCRSPGDPKLGDGGMRVVESEAMKKKKKASMLPLEPGTRIMCRWKDYKYHPVTVMERRKMTPNDYEYYVHYTDFSWNPNLMEWVKLKELDLDSVVTVVNEKVVQGNECMIFF
ncbi:hypothetical protein SO802_027865 [Lithocarpus litseifolius]|uniref:Tudor-knot domain-containing protein n=1 Tax=Lithocarpus litseifolius TaxID=425828 RepID=A0AAW2BQQ8_9ROSI